MTTLAVGGGRMIPTQKVLLKKQNQNPKTKTKTPHTKSQSRTTLLPGYISW